MVRAVTFLNYWVLPGTNLKSQFGNELTLPVDFIVSAAVREVWQRKELKHECKY